MELLSQLEPHHHLIPKPANEEACELGRKRLLVSLLGLSNPSVKERLSFLLQSSKTKALLDALLGNSPYLSSLVFKHPIFLSELFMHGCDVMLIKLLESIDISAQTYIKQNDIMSALRIAKQQVALLTAIADIACIWKLDQVTKALSDFADHALQASLSFLLHQAHGAKEIELKHPKNPTHDCGITILALGKLGGFELNYSSDIDISIFYDPEKISYLGKHSIQRFCIKLTQDLVKVLQERTHEGYVFRCDLRLRPDPASNPIAMSIGAAMVYYETLGQNWERAAMIKARHCAGDQETGALFLRMLSPFIWRKYLDFVAIQDIHSIKRQIESKISTTPLSLEAYNVKLGHGGIREIEFFCQTQQLIWGGREVELRAAPTCIVLQALARAKKITDDVAHRLIEIYHFLRNLEHRLQMVEDQQTHSLPTDPIKLKEIAIFMGFPDTDALLTFLSEQLRFVQTQYAELFKEAPGLGSEGLGSLVFTGTDNDPETLLTLEKMGFLEGSTISERIRGWHHGRYRAIRTKRARELLTELIPSILKAFAKTVVPDKAFLQFDTFLSGVPSGIQIFSLFTANPELLDLIAEIMGCYPFLAENLSRKPILLDYVLYPEFLETLPTLSNLKDQLQKLLGQCHHYEEVLDHVRRFAHDHQFQVGVQLIKGKITTRQARYHLSEIAEVSLVILLDVAIKEFERKRGVVPDGAFAVVAMGKLGSNELNFGSDIDLVFVYDAPDLESESDGLDPLPASTYYTRLARRFLSAFSAPTMEGKLFDIDLRLRPDGENAPIATSLKSFDNYYNASAWTWEYMALTKARVIGGSRDFIERVQGLIKDKISRQRDQQKLASDIVVMREKIARAFYTRDPWHIKHVAGGLIDCEFISQYLLLLHSEQHPEILSTNTSLAFENLSKAGCLERKIAKTLHQCYGFLLDTQSMKRLVYETGPQHLAPAENLKHILTRAMHEESFEALESRLIDTEKTVLHLFNQLIRNEIV